MAEWQEASGPGYRIYLARAGDSLIILLGGGTKKGQHRDIEQAKVLWAEYKVRKTAAKGPKGRE
jgi:putative addiction module killer protein